MEQYDEPRRTDRAQWAVDTAGALAGTEALIDGLGEDNPLLKSLLTNALGEIRQANSGRRLLQRNDYEILMTDALVDHDIMNFYGKDGIPGVTVGSCEALCEGLKQDSNRTDASQCSALPPSPPRFCALPSLTGACALRRSLRLQAASALLVRRHDRSVLAAAQRRGVQTR